MHHFRDRRSRCIIRYSSEVRLSRAVHVGNVRLIVAPRRSKAIQNPTDDLHLVIGLPGIPLLLCVTESRARSAPSDTSVCVYIYARVCVCATCDRVDRFWQEEKTGVFASRTRNRNYSPSARVTRAHQQRRSIILGRRSCSLRSCRHVSVNNVRNRGWEKRKKKGTRGKSQ